MQGFITDRVEPGSTIYTDGHLGYRGIPYSHDTVNHSAKEYVRGDVYTNGIKSFWAVFKRGILGVYHHVSDKHLAKYVGEFQARQNEEDGITWGKLRRMALLLDGKKLTWRELVR